MTTCHGISDKTRELAARPEGVSSHDLVALGYQAPTAQATLCYLVRQGELHRVRVPCAGLRRHQYFGTASAAQQWLKAEEARQQLIPRLSPTARAATRIADAAEAAEVVRQLVQAHGIDLGAVLQAEPASRPQAPAPKRKPTPAEQPQLVRRKEVKHKAPAWGRPRFDAPVQVPRVEHRPAADGELVFTERTKVTVAPPFVDRRFEVEGPIVGGFVSEWRTLRGQGA